MNLKYDLAGKKFGSWLVIKRSNNNHHRMTIWFCICDCGIKKDVRGCNLTNGKSKSCGCKNAEASKKRCEKYRLENSVGDIQTTFFSALIGNAKSRNIEFNISKIYIWELFLKQNKKCAFSNIEINFGYRRNSKDWTASLDRIDNTKGYIEGNVRWVHKKINFMRGIMSDKEFIDWCKLVAKNY